MEYGIPFSEVICENPQYHLEVQCYPPIQVGFEGVRMVRKILRRVSTKKIKFVSNLLIFSENGSNLKKLVFLEFF